MPRENVQMFWDEKESDEVCERVAFGLSEESYAVIDHFLDETAVRSVRAHIDALLGRGDFKQAGIGSAHQFQVNQNIRKDWIHWLDPKDEKSLATLMVFVQRLRKLMDHINQTCFLGLKDVEMHYAVYPQGAFYKRHLDQFKGNDHRRLTFLCYMNDHWQTNDGGLLRLYLKEADNRERPFDILPAGGRLVCFRSDDLEHEVLACHRQRYSLTGWMLDQLNELTFIK